VKLSDELIIYFEKGTNAFDVKKKKYAAFSQKYYACSPEFSTIKHLHIASQSYSEVPNKQTGINKQAW
jgi:hypothetical protein